MDMFVVLYVVAGAFLVVCVIVHGCLCYRRRKLRRRRTGDRKDEEDGLGPVRMDKDTSQDRSHENSVISSAQSEAGERLETRSTASSLLGQDLNEKRRSSSIRVKVLPPSHVLSRSISGGDVANDPDPSKKRLAAELAQTISKSAQKPSEVDKAGECNSNLEKSKPLGEDSGHDQLSKCDTGSSGDAAKRDGLATSDTGSKRTVPVILESKPSVDENERPDLSDQPSKVKVTTKSQDIPRFNWLKRRSYSCDQTSDIQTSLTTILKANQEAGSVPTRSRSASESLRRADKSRTPHPRKTNEEHSSFPSSKTDHQYHILDPRKDIHRHQTLPASSLAKSQSRSFSKKGIIGTLFSRKSKKAEKVNIKDQTPPSSPGAESTNKAQPVIYEEPQSAENSNSASAPVYFVLERTQERDSGNTSDDVICPDKSDNSSKGIGIAKLLKGRKSKSMKTKQSPKKSQPQEESDDFGDAYEVVKIPEDSLQKLDTRVYDTLNLEAPAVPPVSNRQFLLVGKTSTGAPLRKFPATSARRELPETPCEYDVICRGKTPHFDAITRSKTVQPSSNSRPKVQPIAAYAEIGLFDDSASQDPNRRLTDYAYDLLNPDTFVSQNSTANPGVRPAVRPKPQSLRLPRQSRIEYDLLDPGTMLMRSSSITARPKPRPVSRPLLIRANSLSKLRKVSPEVSPKSSKERPLARDKPPNGKPAVPPHKPNLQQSIKPDPVYFTLDPNSAAEHF